MGSNYGDDVNSRNYSTGSYYIVNQNNQTPTWSSDYLASENNNNNNNRPHDQYLTTAEIIQLDNLDQTVDKLIEEVDDDTRNNSELDCINPENIIMNCGNCQQQTCPQCNSTGLTIYRCRGEAYDTLETHKRLEGTNTIDVIPSWGSNLNEAVEQQQHQQHQQQLQQQNNQPLIRYKRVEPERNTYIDHSSTEKIYFEAVKTKNNRPVNNSSKITHQVINNHHHHEDSNKQLNSNRSAAKVVYIKNNQQVYQTADQSELLPNHHNGKHYIDVRTQPSAQGVKHLFGRKIYQSPPSNIPPPTPKNIELSQDNYEHLYQHNNKNSINSQIPTSSNNIEISAGGPTRVQKLRTISSTSSSRNSNSYNNSKRGNPYGRSGINNITDLSGSNVQNNSSQNIHVNTMINYNLQNPILIKTSQNNHRKSQVIIGLDDGDNIGRSRSMPEMTLKNQLTQENLENLQNTHDLHNEPTLSRQIESRQINVQYQNNTTNNLKNIYGTFQQSTIPKQQYQDQQQQQNQNQALTTSHHHSPSSSVNRVSVLKYLDDSDEELNNNSTNNHQNNTNFFAENGSKNERKSLSQDQIIKIAKKEPGEDFQKNYQKTQRVVRNNPWGQMSYKDMITDAILSKEGYKAKLNDIYTYMITNFEYFRERQDMEGRKQWSNSVRHNLSSHKDMFRNEKEDTSKKPFGTKLGGYWSLLPDKLQIALNERAQKTRNSKKKDS